MYAGIKDFISQYKPSFDRIGKANRKAKANLKQRGERSTKEILQEEVNLILAEWDKKTQMGTDAHEFIHKRELKNTPEAIYTSYIEHTDGEMDAQLESNLTRNTTYFEKKIVSNHHHLIGYADRVDVTKQGYINIEDYKTWDKIYRSSSFLTDTGFKVPPTYFYPPLDNLEVCNFNEACLQLSLYMYILWTYNKVLKPGKLFIRHLKLNDKGKILTEELIEVPYLREEVRNLLKHKKINAKSISNS